MDDNTLVPGSRVTKWIFMDDGKTLRADIPDMGVTFTVTPVSQPDKAIDRWSWAYCRPIEVWPPVSNGHKVSGYNMMCTLVQAKKNAVQAFNSWARSVEIIATTDGRGHITLDIGQDYGIRNEVTE